jgi:hypothetical protein
VRLADAVEKTGELLALATELHSRLADLHAALTEPLVELERLVAESTADPRRLG